MTEKCCSKIFFENFCFPILGESIIKWSKSKVPVCFLKHFVIMLCLISTLEINENETSHGIAIYCENPMSYEALILKL